MRSAAQGGGAGRRTPPLLVPPSLAIPSLVAATCAVAHRQIARHNAAADTQRSSSLPAQGSPPAAPALLPSPPESNPPESATLTRVSTRSALAPAGDTSSPS